VNNPFEELVTPAEFGAMQKPPRHERSIHRWMSQPDGLPYIEMPNGAKRIHVPTAMEYLLGRVRQSAPRRAGRAA
jgi:hypothetical protein